MFEFEIFALSGIVTLIVSLALIFLTFHVYHSARLACKDYKNTTEGWFGVFKRRFKDSETLNYTFRRHR